MRVLQKGPKQAARGGYLRTQYSIITKFCTKATFQKYFYFLKKKKKKKKIQGNF